MRLKTLHIYKCPYTNFIYLLLGNRSHKVEIPFPKGVEEQ